MKNSSVNFTELLIFMLLLDVYSACVDDVIL